MSWKDPRCRRDGPQTTALTDPKGWLREAPRLTQRTLQAAGGPRRRRQEALLLERTRVPNDARPWPLSPPIMISMDTIILRERAVSKEAMTL